MLLEVLDRALLQVLVGKPTLEAIQTLMKEAGSLTT
jgi:hypothetical protein